MSKDLPWGNPETFIGEHEEMDLRDLESHDFMVAANTGPRDKVRFICSTMRGPFDFYDMLEEVGCMWKDEQLHAHVTIASIERNKPLKWLDECTIDYIEAKYESLIADAFIGGAFDGYTCRARILDGTEEKKEKKDEETDA